MLRLLPIALLLTPALAPAGHSRHAYFDGGQSADGRFTVTVERIDGPPATKKQPQTHHWQFTWTDTMTGKSLSGKLDGYRRATSPIDEQVHGHIFVAPDGETFAVWNPQALATAATKPPADLTTPEAREYAGFGHRLVIHRKDGEVVKSFGVRDFLADDDWKWLYNYGCQVYWLTEYPKLTTRSTPRPMYAVYRVSPDYTVLEFTVGTTDEAATKAKAKGVMPPTPRVVSVDLTTGRLLAKDEKLTADKTPVQPFTGDLTGGDRKQEGYTPSLDPVRSAGKFAPVEK